MAEKKTAAGTAAEQDKAYVDKAGTSENACKKPSPGGEGGPLAVDEVAAPRKTVTLRLPRARAGEEDTVFIGVNGKAWRIRRGVTVEVPRSVAEVLRNSMSAEERAELYKAALS